MILVRCEEKYAREIDAHIQANLVCAPNVETDELRVVADSPGETKVEAGDDVSRLPGKVGRSYLLWLFFYCSIRILRSNPDPREVRRGRRPLRKDGAQIRSEI